MRKLCPSGMKNLEYVLLGGRTGGSISLERLVVISGRNLHKSAKKNGHGGDGADDLLDVREAPESGKSRIKGAASGKDNLDNPLEGVIEFAGDGHFTQLLNFKYGTGGGIRTHKSFDERF